MKSPLLAHPGAVEASGIDVGVAAHYGGLYTEQRTLMQGNGFVDLSQRDVVVISGPERLQWLHNLTTQWFLELASGQPITALILSPQGRVEHAFAGVDDGAAFTAHTEPGAGAALVEFLNRMKFMTQADVRVADELATMWRPDGATGGKLDFVPRAQIGAYADAVGEPCGLWAYEAIRIARGEPRLGLDTDHKTLPNEVGWLESAVHLNKGCYRGQETVARVHNLGRPPRRLVLLHLDGSENALPESGAELKHDDQVVGFVGSSARHFELGPIALGLVKRNVPTDAQLLAGQLVSSQQIVVDPEVGKHIRPQLS